jgi:hypothetical protein
LHSAVTIWSTNSNSRRVCGGSSSSERPSTSAVKRIRNGDVTERDLDVLDGLPLMLDGLPWPLMLMQQGDRADEREVLRMVAPRPGLTVEEGQAKRVGIDDGDGLQETLCVAVQPQQVGFILPSQQSLDGLRLALYPFSLPRLKPVKRYLWEHKLVHR